MNQNPEQLARDVIDAALERSGWVIQNKKQFNLAAGLGVAIREYQTDAGPADYILFVNQKGTELDERKEEEDAASKTWKKKEPMPVLYNQKEPMESFDFIVIDECHQSIYNLWKHVLDYFDAFQIGLTATPHNRTFNSFEKNIVSDYGYKKALEDGICESTYQTFCSKKAYKGNSVNLNYVATIKS